jgi:hypothetical protein
MRMKALGNFEVDLKPLSTSSDAVGRMSIDKAFHGDLEAVSKGEMLTAMTSVEGSAGYVAVERVTGKLGNRNGSFELIHLGLMDKGAPDLKISVVPDSGTDDLKGLKGAMTITIQDGNHSYEFEYSLDN